MQQDLENNMDYTQIILTVNSSCITILVLLAVILLVATRFRGESGYAAAIIVVPNVPVYLYNMSRMLGWHDFSMFMFPISYSVNTMLMPLLWLFTIKNFHPDFQFRSRQLLHFLPSLVCLVICLAIPVQERMASIVYEMSGDDTWIGNVNTIIIIVQVAVYFPMIFCFLYWRKRKILNRVSDAEWVQKEWIPKLMILFAVLFIIVMICYVIWPRTDTWLIQIFNVIAMSYLVYNTIAHPMILVHPRPETVETENPVPPTLSREQMREICERTSRYLADTRAYLHPDISLASLAKETGIPSRNLSRSINSFLCCNFFELINKMRVEEAKRRLLELETSGYNIDSIFAECGFRSRSTFFLVFKKVVGKTPATWLNEEQKKV